MNIDNLPKIFIASASEARSRSIAEELKLQLNNVADVICWFDPKVFKSGRTTITDLIRVSEECDMGIFVFNDDDEVKIRGTEMLCTRDNVLFEYGLFVSAVGTENAFLLCPKNSANFHLPNDLNGLTNIRFNEERELSRSLYECVCQIKERIVEWKEEKSRSHENNYFKRFYKAEEPALIDNHPIDFNRSFNLLLYMFGQEKFKEFRALDLAFNRWDEASNEDINSKKQGQITNYSKEIIKSVKQLFINGDCTNFRRILVISKLAFSTAEDHNVLKIINEEEKKAIVKRKEILAKRKMVYDPQKEIIETRILFIEHDEHMLVFRNDNDYALFTGDNEEFAIVETTLTSPKLSTSDPICKIVTDSEALNRRKSHFDHFWDNETVSIEDFLKENFQKDKSSTVFYAYNTFSNYYSKSSSRLESTCVFIEMAYVDLIKAEDKRRRSHFERACELLNSLSSIKVIKNNIYLGSFINDFKPKKMVEAECIEFCEVDKLSDPDIFRKLKMDVADELKNRNSSFNLNTNAIATFYMTNTRSAAVKTIKTVSIDPDKLQYLKSEERPDGTKDLYILTNGKNKISLGYEKEKFVIPNCALLMAEHYYELFKFTYEKNPSLKDFWIFDFLLRNEELAVKQGVETARLLFKWPKGIVLHVVNCSYFVDGDGSFRHLGPYQF